MKKLIIASILAASCNANAASRELLNMVDPIENYLIINGKASGKEAHYTAYRLADELASVFDKNMVEVLNEGINCSTIVQNTSPLPVHMFPIDDNNKVAKINRKKIEKAIIHYVETRCQELSE
ncbi:hypothetical protein VOI13_000710 [Escherichia coli]|nr:hypothetical protein [Escherichia coli]